MKAFHQFGSALVVVFLGALGGCDKNPVGTHSGQSVVTELPPPEEPDPSRSGEAAFSIVGERGTGGLRLTSVLDGDLLRYVTSADYSDLFHGGVSIKDSPTGYTTDYGIGSVINFSGIQDGESITWGLYRPDGSRHKDLRMTYDADTRTRTPGAGRVAGTGARYPVRQFAEPPSLSRRVICT
jgi:hypothetical protein